MLPTYLAALGLALAVFAVSGCGGSSKDSSTTNSTTTASTATTTGAAATTPATTATTIAVATGRPLSRAVWISKGDAICTHVNQELSSTTVRNSEEFARLLPQAAAYDHAEAVELSKLVPPPADASDWARILVELQKFSEFSAKAGEYARVKNFKEATPVAKAGNAAQRELVAIAKKDGFKVCSLP